MSEQWPEVLSTLATGGDLSAERAAGALRQILAGDATDAQIAAFIVALRIKGETVEEISGLVDAMLDAAVPLTIPEISVDLVGTGGSATLRDRAFNVSTIASIVAAAAGATVCKHGNRKASSTSGSTDLLEALGVSVELDADGVQRCVADAGVGFCFARMFHPAMRFAGPVRAELGIPTVFNILGPLSHPGRVRRQVLGVADPARVEVIAEVLAARGAEHSLVVHGHDGLDELTTTDVSTVLTVRDGTVTRSEFTPEEVGLARRGVDEIAVGDPRQNAEIARRVLDGAPGAHRDLVLLNAGAGLVVAGIAADLSDGVERAAAAVDSGAASDRLALLVEVSGAASAP